MRSTTIPTAEPMHMLRFGKQTDYQGLLGHTRDSQRRIGYLTRYLTKSIAETYGDDDEVSARQRAHVDRMHQQVRWLPLVPTPRIPTVVRQRPRPLMASRATYSVPGRGLRLQRAVLKSGEGGMLFIDSLKSKRTRTVPLVDDVVPIVDRWAEGKESDDFLFSAAHGGPLAESNRKRSVDWTTPPVGCGQADHRHLGGHAGCSRRRSAGAAGGIA
jgi:hypothetical protein